MTQTTTPSTETIIIDEATTTDATINRVKNLVAETNIELVILPEPDTPPPHNQHQNGKHNKNNVVKSVTDLGPAAP